MLAMILFEVGHTEDGLSVAQDGATLSQRAGFELELRDLSRSCRRPLPGAPGPLGRSGLRMRPLPQRSNRLDLTNTHEHLSLDPPIGLR